LDNFKTPEALAAGGVIKPALSFFVASRLSRLIARAKFCPDFGGLFKIFIQLRRRGARFHVIDMKVWLVNNGPVTIIMDSKLRE
jgi:hypothetical protein